MSTIYRIPTFSWLLVAFTLVFVQTALAQQRITTIVSSAGAIIQGPDGVQLTIPSGIVDHPVEISIERISPQTLCTAIEDDLEPIGSYYRISASEVVSIKNGWFILYIPLPRGTSSQGVFGYIYDWSDYAADLSDPARFFWSSLSYPPQNLAVSLIDLKLTLIVPESSTVVLVRKK